MPGTPSAICMRPRSFSSAAPLPLATGPNFFVHANPRRIKKAGRDGTAYPRNVGKYPQPPAAATMLTDEAPAWRRCRKPATARFLFNEPSSPKVKSHEHENHRSEERRVGKARVSTGRSRLWQEQ